MPKQTHQLTAIMFTDIVGYTALMGEDETGAYQLLKRNRQVQKPLIEKHNGKWLKEMGDGVLARFHTISDAVYCAIDIQLACKKESDLKLRIGIHQGEVIVEDGDVIGDGVNIASRLEPLAPAGGIYVSESVFRNIENKKGIKVEFVREETLKNVKRPVRIYEVQGTDDFTSADPLHEGQARTADHRSSSLVKKVLLSSVAVIVIVLLAYFFFIRPEGENIQNSTIAAKDQEISIAVLPFKNFSGDPELEHF